MSIIKKTDNAQHRLKCESTITLVENSICSTTLESHLVSLTKSEPQAIPLLGTQSKCLHVCTPRHLQKCSCSIICNSPYWNNPVSINYRLHILIVIWSEKGTLHTNESIKTTALWNNTVEFHKHSVEERKTNTKAGILSTLLIESEKKTVKVYGVGGQDSEYLRGERRRQCLERGRRGLLECGQCSISRLV